MVSSLRRHLNDTGAEAHYRTGDFFECDDDAADVPKIAISRIEQEWLAQVTSNYFNAVGGPGPAPQIF